MLCCILRYSSAHHYLSMLMMVEVWNLPIVQAKSWILLELLNVVWLRSRWAREFVVERELLLEMPTHHRWRRRGWVHQRVRGCSNRDLTWLLEWYQWYRCRLLFFCLKRAAVVHLMHKLLLDSFSFFSFIWRAIRVFTRVLPEWFDLPPIYILFISSSNRHPLRGRNGGNT